MTVTEEPAMKATIYHNPACGTSRNTLALIRHAGIEPDVVEYLQADMAKAKERGAPSVVETEWTSDKHEALMAELLAIRSAVK